MAVPRTRRGAHWAVWLGAIMMVVLTYYRTLYWLWLTWLGNPYYGHGMLVPLIAAAIAWRLEAPARESADGFAEDAGTPLRFAAIGAVGGALLIHLWMLRTGSYLVSALSLILALAGVILALGGGGTLRRHAFPLLFLVMMVPLPWLETLSPVLARWTAQWAGGALAALGANVTVSGARVTLPTADLVVGAPCSGVNSLAALSTLAVLYGYIVRGTVAARVVLVMLSLPMALLANWVRVAILIALAHWVSAEVALDYFHDWSGALLFLVAMGLLFGVGKVLGCDGIRSDI